VFEIRRKAYTIQPSRAVVVDAKEGVAQEGHFLLVKKKQRRRDGIGEREISLFSEESEN